ncbi:helix-turn-helix transcriptional regulator [Nonomuraea sp. NPDC002799]
MGSGEARSAALLGRETETAVITEILDRACRGHSHALVVHGPMGIGKSALLDWAMAATADIRPGVNARIVHVRGVEAEAELPYAALHMLFGDFVEQIDALPVAQAVALRSALGMLTSDTPPITYQDRFLVGLAVISLLSRLANRGLLLCVIDDAHWVDQVSADALWFAARRLGTEGVVMLFSVRDGERKFDDPDLPEMRLTGLEETAAHTLLTQLQPGLDETSRRRVVAAADGNPLALVEFGAALIESGLEAFNEMDLLLLPGPAPDRAERTFGDRVRALPAPARTLLLLAAAADESGDLTVLLAAAGRVGASFADLEPAEAAGLIHLSGSALTFRHPLIRRVVYQQATLVQRFEIHQTLALVLHREEQADRRAWHMAAGTPGLDDAVAIALEGAANRASARGSYAASATAYERAASFTADQRRRVRLLISSAQSDVSTGRLNAAAEVATRASLLAPDPEAAAEIALISSHFEYARTSSSAACRTLLHAVSPLVHTAPHVAERMLTSVCRALQFAPDPVVNEMAAPLIDAVVAKLEADARARLVAIQLAAQFAAGGFEAASELRYRVDHLIERPASANTMPDELLTIGLLLLVADDRAALSRTLASLAACRERGVTGSLAEVLHRSAWARLQLGALRQSRADAVEGLTLAEATGSELAATRHREILAMHAAMAGDEAECRELAYRCEAFVGSRDEPHYAVLALCLLNMGYCRYEAALSHAGLVTADVHGYLYMQLAPNRVEAAARLGCPERAAEPLAHYLQWSDALAGNSAVAAIAYRCRALIASDDEAQELWRTALDLHVKEERPFECARTLLLYGEWLRRVRKQGGARTYLREALDRFERLGAIPWADRARAALRASGVTAVREERNTDVLDRLTPQESNVVHLAIKGLSNKDIATRLFLSPRTVAYHLSNVYRKLGVASRMALAQLLARQDVTENPTDAA